MALDIISKINLDLKEPNTVTVYATQYDSVGRVRCQLLNDGEQWEVPSGAGFLVNYRKSDNIGGFYDTTERGETAIAFDSTEGRSVIYLNLDTQTMTTVGKVNVQVSFYGSNKARLSTFSFYLQVQKSVVGDQDLESEWTFRVLSDALGQTIKNQEDAIKWMEANIRTQQGYVVDDTLNVKGAAGDAKKIGELYNEIIAVQTAQPTSEWNKIWVKPSDEDIEIPTMEEFNSITEQTRNLIIASIPKSAIQSNGKIVSSGQEAYMMWVSEVVAGKTYAVTTNDASGLVYGYFSTKPEVGDSALTGRLIQAAKTFTASITGYVAFRSNNGYEYAQIEEGEYPTSYIQPLTAKDILERETNLNRIKYQFYALGQGITPSKISTIVGFDVFSDMNNVGVGLYRNNSVFRFSDFTSTDDIENAPVKPFNGYLITYGDVSSGTDLYAQMAITNTGVIFTRTQVSKWRRVIDMTQFDTMISNLNIVSGFHLSMTPERITSEDYGEYADLNNIGLPQAPSNSIIRYSGFTQPNQVAHTPVSIFNGIIVSLSPTAIYSEALQFAMDSNGLFATRYFRRGYSYTYDWRIIERPVYDVKDASTLFNLLTTINTGIIHLREFEYDMYTNLYENLILEDKTERHFIDGEVTIVGAGTRLKLHVPKDVAEAHVLAANATSIIDILGNAHISGIIFDCKNTRYCCHYEAMTNSNAFYKNITFDDCEFNYTRELTGLNGDCIGIGGSLGQKFRFKNCRFTNDVKGGIYIHTRQWAIGSVDIENCIFECAWYGVNLSQYTGTTAPIPVYFITSDVGLVLISTQSGGNTDVQWKIIYINTKHTQTISEGTKLIYDTKEINTVS